MSVAHIEILVEEPSMEAALRLIVPRILGHLSFDVYPHQGKQDLLDKLPARLRGYKAWLPEDYRIMVIVDRDDEDCYELKALLQQAARSAGLVPKPQTKSPDFHLVNRLAIEELEAWYFGDWHAVQTAYPGVNSNIPNKQGYRDPDAISGGTWESFERVLQRAKYFKSGLRKIEAARTIAPHMEPQRNSSRSFCVFRDALNEMASSK